MSRREVAPDASDAAHLSSNKVNSSPLKAVTHAPDPSLLCVPHDSYDRGGPYRAARPEPEGLRSVCHSPVRKAPPYRRRLVSQGGASEVRRGASVECPGDHRSVERETMYPGGIGHLRGPVRRSGVCARIHGGQAGAGDSQDERTSAGDPGGSGLRFEALRRGEEDSPVGWLGTTLRRARPRRGAPQPGTTPQRPEAAPFERLRARHFETVPAQHVEGSTRWQ